MISHREAEILTSSRQDEPLDPIVERELQAHLATCDECRAFAIATERLTAGIKSMPSIPVNPRMRREVMEQVRAGRNPLARVFAGMGGGFQSGPIFAAVAAVLIIGLVGWLALDRLVLNDGGGDGVNQIAAVPTEAPVETFLAPATQPVPTETTAPTATSEPVPTETSIPTATNEPQPTETSEPEPTASSEPVPTATNEPLPTATDQPQPTATSEPLPTETTAPTATETQVAARNQGPIDLTTATDEPTVTQTPEPTPEPTATATVEPTAPPTPTPTSEPTAIPEPTQTPAIEPMDGQTVATEVPTEPTTNQTSSTEAKVEPTGESVGSSAGTNVIEPIGNGPDSGTVEGPASTPGSDVETDSESETSTSQPLMDVSQPYTGIDGDPSGRLGLTSQGRLEFMAVPDSASMTTAEGYRLQTADAQPAVVNVCGDGFCEPGAAAPEVEGWQGDSPLGVVGNTAYFMRMYGDRTEIMSASTSGTQLIDPQVMLELGPESPPSAVYENDGVLFAWLPSGQWLEIQNGSANAYSGGYGNPTNVRFAPVANQGPLMGYFSGGSLIIAPITSPDSPVFSIPSDGVDFDMTPLADRVAVIRGNDIVIFDINGNELMIYEGGDMQPGSLIWLNGGIVFIDTNTGLLYQIPETAS